jgi:hypothetical protein
MARKASYEEPVDYLETEEINEEAAAAVADLRAARRRRNAQPQPTDKPTAAILPIYLREMGSTPLIDEHQEVELARELQEAREGLRRLALKLACVSPGVRARERPVRARSGGGSGPWTTSRSSTPA